ncbi:hypothetical protein IKD67_02065 [Candidatus Saccharibacteria bacterium]|nr:hypothetical protein [Candidatus Saccharibacteria bacterium]
MILKQEHKSSSPIINLDQSFKQYGKVPLEELMVKMAKVIKASQLIVDEDMLESYEKCKSQLFMRLASASGKESIMESSPYRLIGDILLTYYVLFPAEASSFYSARVNNRLMRDWGISEEELYEDAVKSTVKLFPPTITTLVEATTGIADDECEALVVSNKQMMFGAAALFIPSVTSEVVERMGGGFIAIPSSVHEWLVISTNSEFRMKDLRETLKQANQTVTRPEDILSWVPYYYSAEEGVFHALDNR